MSTSSVERRYEVTLIRPRGERLTLLIPRTAEEIAQLRAHGHKLTAVSIEEPFRTFPRLLSPTPAPKANAPRNEPKPNPYADSLTALAKLIKHAEATRNDGLEQRAIAALAELLKGSGIKASAE